MENQDIRFYINLRRKLGIKADDAYQELKAAIPDQHPSRRTVTENTSQTCLVLTPNCN